MVKVKDHREVRTFRGKVSFFGMGTLKTFAFLWDGNLVDTGPGTLERKFLPAFLDSPVRRVLLTHFHEDHSGNAARLQMEMKVPVFADPGALDLLRRDAGLPFYRRYIWGKRRKLEPVPYGEAVDSENGRLEVIKTPGHSQDHVCLLNRREGFIFTGDLFVTPGIRAAMRGESVPEIIRSLKRLLQEDFETLYCAHAGVVEKGREMVEKKLAYLEELSERVLGMHRQGLSSREINRKIFGKAQMLDYISLGEWSSRHIISSIIKG
ncbi:MAG: MBL fold metallo-hydrolase [Firmicutes bacterium]|nr:MBL fold metallo-hydrolase [Bacillota bacterium]MCL5058467.1 MBL fold metallo-hydrolase [Actinomycetota bacterium]